MLSKAGTVGLWEATDKKGRLYYKGKWEGLLFFLREKERKNPKAPHWEITLMCDPDTAGTVDLKQCIAKAAAGAHPQAQRAATLTTGQSWYAAGTYPGDDMPF